MFNLLYALLCACATYAVLALPHLLTPAESVVPAVLAALVAYFLLARRTFRALQHIVGLSGQALQTQPPQVQQAIAMLQRGYPLARQQLGVRSQLDAQLGILYFVTRDYNRAQPLLARSFLYSPWLAGAMLGVVQYKKKDVAEMKRTFNIVTRKGKKQGLAWNLYAYLLLQQGERDEAQRVLTEGVRHAGAADPRLGEALLALQNNKRFKMRAYKEQWYQFHLENPPVVYQQAPRGSSKVSRIARRGRW